MNGLVELGIITRPHGYRGDFIVKSDSGLSSALSQATSLYLGKSLQEVREIRILESAWMPKGWKLRAENISTEEEAIAVKGYKVFAKRETLAELSSDEYYVCDLIGMEAINIQTGIVLGQLTGVETSDAGTEWWVIKDSGREIMVPPRARYIHSVDLKAGRLLLSHVEELV